jgi:pSer/pThr/pTyr-binding forkhead associated (FHA) protein
VDGRAPREVALGNKPVTFGRHDSADVVIDSPYVGRLHARVRATASGHEIVDLDSRNGVFVNGQRISGRRRLRDGDVIEIATQKMTYGSAAQADGSRGDSTLVMPSPGAGHGEGGGRRAGAHEGFVVDEEAHEARIDGREIDLAPLEFALVAALAARQGKVCKSRDIGDALWGAERWDANMLYALMRRLRRKLQEAGADEAVSIVNVEGVGYKLVQGRS